MPRTGRPKKPIPDLTPIKVRQLASVLNEQQMADYFEVGINTLRRRFDDDPALLGAYKSGKARAIAAVGGSLLEQVRKQNLSAMIFYLKTQAGWRERLEVDLSDFNEQEASDQQLERIASGEPPERVLKLVPKAS